ncbi:hypothetical protein HY972_02590 [Candidatus Kaiserbacteria bacterium]|nr:hypothetical protein [Candidatus Kaiserbacteria bacterium]
MRKYALVIGIVAIAVLLALWAIGARVANAPGPRACTQEAKICPDGSSVGRTGPNCEFAPCPTADAASTTGGVGILPYNSGVRGTVMLGPTCPVARIPPDHTCADKPYAAAITVYRAGSELPFIIGNSDASGTFNFSLPPGSYTLAPSGGKALPRCLPVDVSVPPTGYVAANISCDTGIR